MSDDIVERMRRDANYLHGCDEDGIADRINQAAAEIARLRQSVEIHMDGFMNLSTDHEACKACCDSLQVEITRLRAQVASPAASASNPVAFAVYCDGEIVEVNIFTDETIAKAKKAQLDRLYPQNERVIVPLVPAASPSVAPQDERLRKALERIDMLACFASEEDTDSGPAVLLEIGKVARAALSPDSEDK